MLAASHPIVYHKCDTHAGKHSYMRHVSALFLNSHCRAQFMPLQRYDFGSNCGNLTNHEETCNQHRYGSMQPPEYDLSKVRRVARCSNAAVAQNISRR